MSSMPPVVAATSDLAVVRFHGHNEEWESGSVQKRFKYLYSEKELETGPADRGTVRRSQDDARPDEQLLQGLRTTKRKGTRRAPQRVTR